MLSYVERKFELEDTVIELHNRARYLEATTNETEIVQKIREMADELSAKLRKEQKHEWNR